MTKLSHITYAGHSAVFIGDDAHTIAIDPWLAGNPLCPKHLQSGKKVDLVVLTHGHSDHASDALRVANESGAALAATYELAMIMINEGIPAERVLPMNKGGSLSFNGVTITLTHAMHSSSFDTNNGTVYAGEPCGVVLQDGNTSIYHAGDTALFSDLSLIKERFAPDIALLPIGDRFTMGPQEAAHAAELVGAKKVIPIHFGTFDMLTGTPSQFTEACKARGLRAEVVVMEPGEVLAV